MSYPDYIQREARRAEKNAELFASVGLGWLAGIESRRAQRLESLAAQTKQPKKSNTMSRYISPDNLRRFETLETRQTIRKARLDHALDILANWPLLFPSS